MELWDGYDRDFNKIDDLVLERGKDIPDGVFHLVCEVIVMHIDGSFLMMQRDFRKHLGGKWELTAGGSALLGERATDCAKRELQEETGIESSSLVEIGRSVNNERHTLYVEYLCTTDCNKDSITLQPSETIAFKWIKPDDLKKLDVRDLASSRTIEDITMFGS